ncbi:hypothetical protein LTR85_001057 [Meristemomyces frigidus]|nr:hypothetical protein LTR85_001057 [Meristemomyces frigidus]
MAPRGAQSLLGDTVALQSVQEGDVQNILKVFEQLREAGIEKEVVLPRMVTAGDTSAGKSSVLERLTGLPFPSGKGVVTRFATEVVIRPAKKDEIHVSIIPDQDRARKEKLELSRFHVSISTVKEFQRVYKEAPRHMGLRHGNALVGDRLRIDISGPMRSLLTVIDLPGLIQATSATTSDADLTLSHKMVEDYIKQPRTIILATVSAANDVLNQAITEKARQHDPEGRRTMGIITKPDVLKKNGPAEKQWMELAQNQNITLQLGWHVLVNKVDGADNAIAEEIRDQEAEFFSHPRFAGLAQGTVGLDALVPRLCGVAHKHLVTALPELQREFQTKLSAAEVGLQRIGYLRADTRSQRTFLASIGRSFEYKATAAIEGNYSDTFFRELRAEPANRNLRAVVQDLNTDYARAMRLFGATIRIEGAPLVDNITDDAQENGPRNYSEWVTRAEDYSRTQAMDWVRREMKVSRGSELPGSVNNALVRQLFWKLSQSWEALTSEHITRVDEACNRFIDDLLSLVAGKDAEDVKKKLKLYRVDGLLKTARERALERLAELCDDENGPPITYNQSYVGLVQRARNRRTMGEVDRIVTHQNEAFHGLRADDRRQAVDIQSLTSAFEYANCSQRGADEFAAEETLDQVIACYYAVLTYFIDAVTKQVVERQIVQQVPKLLSSEWVAGLSDEELKEFAEEKPEVQKKRTQLEDTRKRMTTALQKFKKELAGIC